MFSHHKEFFTERETLGVILNTDGIPLFKSSPSAVWPVYLEIANLPPHLRFRHDNTITCGVWVGRKKPSMSLILNPVMEDIKYMNVIGVSVNSPEGVSTVRIKLLFGIFDMIAKAAVLNVKQFNGSYGCPTCLHPGVRIRNNQTYPPSTTYQMRTLTGIQSDIAEGKRTGEVIRGIKAIV